MKSKNQDNSPMEILDVESLNITVLNGKQILILKPRNAKTIAYRLPDDFVQRIIQSQEENRKLKN